MMLSRILVSGAALACLLPLACVNTSVGGRPAEYNSLTGNLTSHFEAPLDRAFAAATDAINELQFQITGSPKDALKGIITARTADGTWVTVTTERKTETLTGVTVGVGTFGGQSLAQTVMDKIAARLK
jgi:hypothetical protein